MTSSNKFKTETDRAVEHIKMSRAIAIVGNGGNLAIAQHAASDLSRYLGKFAFAPDAVHLTACGSDGDWHDKWIKYAVNQADFVIGITTRLDSPITKGLESEFGIGFENEPKSLKVRGSSNNFDKKVAGKKRLLTRDQKNELLAKTSMTYYESKIASGEMTIENVMFAIKDAFERKKNFEEMGYILPEGKTKYPYWEGEDTEN